ncbi:hypothetical protein ACIP69_02760 [Streptomyces hygroscopicus]|uniref:hypothetical protein n=1 Tax=Streptomyces hygroscopicus TaxID=1912 RepID=UPI0009A0187A|nr:hypothetical protein [Streptomyces hygroscopicus]
MDTSADNANLKAQYAAQVAADLERNAAEHERLSSQIATLQKELGVLEENRALLLTMRQALGDGLADGIPESGDVSAAEKGAAAEATPAAPESAESAESAETTLTTPESGESAAAGSEAATPPARKPRKRAEATGGKRKRAEPSPSRAKRVREAKAPTLRDLVHDTLVRHGGPRSAAEITTALAEAHPDREVKPTVVRSTLESLVAKGQAHRTKQQKSVFYSPATPDAATGTAEPGEARA